MSKIFKKIIAELKLYLAVIVIIAGIVYTGGWFFFDGAKEASSRTFFLKDVVSLKEASIGNIETSKEALIIARDKYDLLKGIDTSKEGASKKWLFEVDFLDRGYKEKLIDQKLAKKYPQGALRDSAGVSKITESVYALPDAWFIFGKNTDGENRCLILKSNGEKIESFSGPNCRSIYGGTTFLSPWQIRKSL